MIEFSPVIAVISAPLTVQPDPLRLDKYRLAFEAKMLRSDSEKNEKHTSQEK